MILYISLKITLCFIFIEIQIWKSFLFFVFVFIGQLLKKENLYFTTLGILWDFNSAREFIKIDEKDMITITENLKTEFNEVFLSCKENTWISIEFTIKPVQIQKKIFALIGTNCQFVWWKFWIISPYYISFRKHVSVLAKGFMRL